MTPLDPEAEDFVLMMICMALVACFVFAFYVSSRTKSEIAKCDMCPLGYFATWAPNFGCMCKLKEEF